MSLKHILKLCILLAFALSEISTAAIKQNLLDYQARTVYYKNFPSNSQGDFSFDFQTSNGITTKAAGNEFGHSGVVQYVSAEGIPITWTYVADENGYQPKGDHIPQTPDYILKSLEYIRTHPNKNNGKYV